MKYFLALISHLNIILVKNYGIKGNSMNDVVVKEGLIILLSCL